MSSTFSKFFQKVFRDQLRSLLRQLNYYITFSFLCQAIFKKFFQLVSVFLPEWTSLTLPLLFLFPKVKVIFSSLSPAVTRARQQCYYIPFPRLCQVKMFFFIRSIFGCSVQKRSICHFFHQSYPDFSFIYNVAVANIFIYHF